MNIIVVTFSKLPNGNAGAVRDFTFGKLLRSIGHNVFFIGMGADPYRINKEYYGFQYVSLRINGTSKLNKFLNYLGYGFRLKKFLKEYHENFRIDVIWVVDIPINALIMVKRFAEKNNMMLVHDSVEWYSPEQFKLGKLSPAYVFKDIYNRYLIDKQFKVVAISKFLRNHFTARAINAVRIPVILDMEELKYIKRSYNKQKIILLYAGSPGKKDYLKEVIEGTAMLDDEQIQHVELRILGVALEEIIKLSGVEESCLYRMKDCMKVLGRVPRETVLENLKQTDFTVLLRPSEQRYAKAGFPTKVVESLATGTPVILNISSDLDEYITDLENGLVVTECSSKAFNYTLMRALQLTYDDKIIMQRNARKCAEENFDYRTYGESMKYFVYK